MLVGTQLGPYVVRYEALISLMKLVGVGVPIGADPPPRAKIAYLHQCVTRIRQRGPQLGADLQSGSNVFLVSGRGVGSMPELGHSDSRTARPARLVRYD